MLLRALLYEVVRRPNRFIGIPFRIKTGKLLRWIIVSLVFLYFKLFLFYFHKGY